MPEGECRPCPILPSYTLAFALQLRKNHRKTSVRLAEKCQLGTIRFVNQAAVATVTDCKTLGLPFRGIRLTLGQHKYPPSCQTKGFPASANFGVPGQCGFECFKEKCGWKVSCKQRHKLANQVKKRGESTTVMGESGSTEFAICVVKGRLRNGLRREVEQSEERRKTPCQAA